MGEIYLEPPTGSSTEKSTSTSSGSYKVGDDVYIATASGKLKATIKEISGKKVFDNYKSPMYENAWAAIGTLSKEK